MRKFVQRIVMLAVLAMLIGSLTFKQNVAHASPPIDCDFIGALCRLTSSTNYQICILKGGNPSDCAWIEALETLNCIANAGCGPAPKPPPDN